MVDSYQWKTPMAVLDFCKRHEISLDQYYGRKEIYSTMDMIDYTEVPRDFRPSYLSSLQLDKIRGIPQDFCTVFNSLHIRGGTCQSLGGVQEVLGYLTVIG